MPSFVFQYTFFSHLLGILFPFAAMQVTPATEAFGSHGFDFWQHVSATRILRHPSRWCPFLVFSCTAAMSHVWDLNPWRVIAFTSSNAANVKSTRLFFKVAHCHPVLSSTCLLQQSRGPWPALRGGLKTNQKRLTKRKTPASAQKKKNTTSELKSSTRSVQNLTVYVKTINGKTITVKCSNEQKLKKKKKKTKTT